MNPLLAAITHHRAAQMLAKLGALDLAGQAYARRDECLREARAIRNLNRLVNQGENHV